MVEGKERGSLRKTPVTGTNPTPLRYTENFPGPPESSIQVSIMALITLISLFICLDSFMDSPQRQGPCLCLSGTCHKSLTNTSVYTCHRKNAFQT